MAHMNRKTLIGLAAPLVLSLTACAGANYKASAKCNSNGVCEAGIEISGTMANSSLPGTMLEKLLLSNVVPDAAAVELDVSESTVGIPGAGFLTASLVNSVTGITQASAVFAWHKVGSRLKLSNPDSVNEWALAHGGAADTFKYDLHPFTVTQTEGINIFHVTQEVDGVSVISSSTSWTRGRDHRCNEYASCQVQ